MIVTRHYPCPVTGILRGRRTPATVVVKKRVELDIREVAAPDLLPVITWRPTGRHEESFVHHADLGLLMRIDPVDVDRAEKCQHVLGFELPEELAKSEWIDEFPEFKELQDDRGTALEAAMAERAANCVVVDGVVFRPAVEPYLHMGVTREKFYHAQFMTDHGPNRASCRNAYRVADIDQFMSDAVNRFGANEAYVRQMIGAVDVHTPELLQFDTNRAHAINAADGLRGHFSHLLHGLPIEMITAWAKLRDFQEEWRRRPDLAPIENLLAAANEAFEVLQHDHRTHPSLRRELETALRNYPASPALDPADEIALGAYL